jgi:hypothetical protein
MRRTLVLALLAAPLMACPAPATALARAQETAQEFNLNTRFGRNEIAIDSVATSARDTFLAQHHGWGTSVRLADVEVAGMHSTGERTVDVIVRATWYRPEEQELRTTMLKQSWRDQNGWQLITERRTEGDVGLLGERVIYQTPQEAREPAQFPTIRLGAGSTEAE